ncbi:SDR family NAD(P)-dependent oxidoreductase [Rhodococcus wratislaviensis]|uniref:SDR family NAD(P)-dependent oxidoreductase n=1 Tax=Rhodococcus wratislaviensis TaxID=44752 RepID=UPI00364F32CC
MIDLSPLPGSVFAAHTFDVSGKVAIVTGASSGIGAQCARTLAMAGARVAWVARRRDVLVEAARHFEGSVVVEADLSAEGAIAELFAQVHDQLGTPDILVNAAGRTNIVAAEDESIDDFRAVLDLNLSVPFLTSQAFARAVGPARGGAIVNIASVNAVVAGAAGHETSYGASKSGVLGLTRELAFQWAKRGIRVNAIGPGYFPTEMTESLFETEEGQQWLRRRTPMRRGGRLPELDGPLLLLASDAGSYMTGQHLLVDGGWTLV